MAVAPHRLNMTMFDISRDSVDGNGTAHSVERLPHIEGREDMNMTKSSRIGNFSSLIVPDSSIDSYARPGPFKKNINHTPLPVKPNK